MLGVAAAHPDVRADPPAEVEFVEAGLAGLRFQLQVWTNAHVKGGGKLKSDLLFEIWRELGNAGLTMPQAAVTLALPTLPAPNVGRHTHHSREGGL
jgi:small-conductance mechanosensitive channel